MQKTIVRIVAAIMIVGLLLGAIGPLVLLSSSQSQNNVQETTD